MDYLHVAVLDLASGPRIALIRHSRNQATGTELHVLPQQFASATDLPGFMATIDRHQDSLVTETLSALGIDAQEVSWRRLSGCGFSRIKRLLAPSPHVGGVTNSRSDWLFRTSFDEPLRRLGRRRMLICLSHPLGPAIRKRSVPTSR